MEGQNHVSYENSHHEKHKHHSPKPHSHTSSPVKHDKHKLSSSHQSKEQHSLNSSSHKSPTPSKHKDGVVKSSNHHHHSKPRENSTNSSSSHGIPKHKDGSSSVVKHKDGSIRPKDPSLKPKDPNLKHRDPNLKAKDPSLKNKDHSTKPKEPSLKPKDPSQKPRDPSLKPKDPNMRPKDPNYKSKDPSLKHKEHNSKPSDPNKPRDPSLKPKDPNKKLKEGYVRMKDGSIRLKDPNAKSSSGSIKPKDPNRHSSSSSGDSKNQIKKEKRPDGTKGEVRKDGQVVKRPDGSTVVIKREGEHAKKHHSSDPSKVKVKVKTENDGKPRVKHKEGSAVTKVKTENGAVSVKSPSPVKSVKREPESDDEDEIPLNQRLQTQGNQKRPLEDSEDDEPLTARIEKVKKQKVHESDDEFVPVKPKKRKTQDEDDEDFDDKPLSNQWCSGQRVSRVSSAHSCFTIKEEEKGGRNEKEEGQEIKWKRGKTQKKKKKEEATEVWKWWEEEPLPEGVKWKFLEHKGPVFAPLYEPIPPKIKFFYNGEHLLLSPEAEEVAGFYARMLDHEYTTKEAFNKNFFRDWRKVMTGEEQALIKDLKKCDFSRMHKYFLEQAELRKNRTKEEKQRRGESKMGMLKKRIRPEQVIINCSKDSKFPEAPAGHKWRDVIHDDKVTWLCSWTENIQGSNKYVMLNPSSRLKGEKDWMKYETARKLKKCVNRIQDEYRQDWKSKEMRIRQRAVALYFIDKLALRAGNEKEEGETADTVGCCSLRVEHIKLHEEDEGQEFVVEFDFLGKDSIRYQNKVPVEKRVFKNIQLFVENKQGEDDLFDRLNTSILNKYLQDLMPGLTAKVFRTYNASSTLQDQLKALTVAEDSIPSKLLAYNRANRAVAVLCNHQRAAPKTFDKQMANLQDKVKAKMTAIKNAKKDLKSVRNEYKQSRNEKMKQLVERKKKAVERLEDQLAKLEMKATDKEENKEIALGTSKLNYLDPRISVAWCKKWKFLWRKSTTEPRGTNLDGR
ncbi:putative DNA topoisomerase 1 [Apostichopus japonicus]|uniref:DNA topoisomerase I n=1 Tax=Stichopus japonicus TaxID=307972 RepID=A0A2G8LQV0_STIJA|nr:putative DNA topoisomerase 1 [Apostichopus japonicus]